jgi:hypothetical protein
MDAAIRTKIGLESPDEGSGVKMRYMALALALAIVTMAFILVPSVSADVLVSVDPKARLVDDGAAVSVRVTVQCTAGREVLEALLTVSQVDQTIVGTGGSAGVTCDGKAHKHRVRVNAQEGSFHKGEAFASAFVLVLDPTTGTTEQGQASGTISIK